MSNYERTQLVKSLALESGFDLVGICPPDPLEEERLRLMDWLSHGFHGGMNYLAREPERRCDPKEILPGAKSVIVLGLHYYPGSHGSEPSPAFGRSAKYAAGRDYHEILQSKLERFVESLRDKVEGEFRARFYVDTGPVLERPLAQRTGIGFTGKHTLTITRKFGSWIFLAELITDLALEFDKPDLRDCGTCRRCVEACPTGAIFEDYKMDASRCISYLTIEHRGPIDPALREQMGDWVFGCDICQDVCPLNQHVTTNTNLSSPRKRGSTSSGSPIKAFGDDTIAGDGTVDGTGNSLWLDIEELLNMRTSEEFREKFRGRAHKRAKREGLVRNAAIAAGNSGREEFVPALKETLLKDESETVQEAAAWALKKFEYAHR